MRYYVLDKFESSYLLQTWFFGIYSESVWYFWSNYWQISHSEYNVLFINLPLKTWIAKILAIKKASLSVYFILNDSLIYFLHNTSKLIFISNILHLLFSTTTRSTGRCWNRRPHSRPPASREQPTERLSPQPLLADDKHFLMKQKFEKDQKITQPEFWKRTKISNWSCSRNRFRGFPNSEFQFQFIFQKFHLWTSKQTMTFLNRKSIFANPFFQENFAQLVFFSFQIFGASINQSISFR